MQIKFREKSEQNFSRVLFMLVLVGLLLITGCDKSATPTKPNGGDNAVTDVEEKEKEVAVNNYEASTQGAIDFVDGLLKKELKGFAGARLLLLKSDNLEQEYNHFLYLFFLENNLKSLISDSIYDREKEYPKYLTKEEIRTRYEQGDGDEDYWQEDSIDAVFKKTDVQALFDKIWCPGAFNVNSWTDGEDYRAMVFTSKSGYVVTEYPQHGWEFGEIFYKILGAEALNDKEFVVRLQIIEVDEEYGTIDDYDCNIIYHWKVTVKALKGNPSFDEVLSRLKFKKNIGIIEIEVWHTKDGMRLKGRRPENGLIDYNLDINAEYRVSASGGLRIRKGPGTSYDSIVVIPNGSDVYAYGTLKNNKSWYYVIYDDEKKGIHYQGWVSAQYLVKRESDSD